MPRAADGRRPTGAEPDREPEPDRRPDREAREPGRPTTRRRTSVRRILSVVGLVASVALVIAALVLPSTAQDLSLAAFARIPLEGLLIALLLLVLPRRAGRIVAIVAGVVLGAMVLVKLLDIVVGVELGRPFDPVSDIGQLDAGAGVVADALGTTKQAITGVGIALAVVCVALPVAPLLRIARPLREHRPRVLPVLSGLVVVWVVCALVDARLVPGVPLASADAAAFTVATAQSAAQSAAAVRSFQTALAAPDPYASEDAHHQLAGLAGKDVLVVFVESYGEVAIRDSSFSDAIDATLATDTQRLADAGYATRSAMLTSPTYGGISWLAHSTLQSGVWVPNQQSYDRLIRTDRYTLARAFRDAGWRTVSDIPSDATTWTEGQRFYGYQQLDDARNVGYAGPTFGYARIPDQYTLAQFRDRELAPGHAPVMAEIDLVSSHTPWTPLPRLVPDAQLGDGSIYDEMPAEGETATVAWQDPAHVQQLYGQSIRYSLDAVTDFVVQAHDPDLVVLMLGDHEPAEIVSGAHASHDVPVSLISADPAVMDATDAWHWTPGLEPAASAPVWRMDAVRDRFLDAFRR